MSERLQLLADASRMLAESALEYAATLEALAKIVVPRIADDCVVFILDEHDRIHRVTEASVSTENAAVLRNLREHPPSLGASNSVVSAVRSGQTVFVDVVDDRMLANLAGSTEHAAALKAVHPTTFITVPLFGRGKVIGAFTFGMSVSARRYDADDVALAEELGRRAGMALENARLLREAVAARQRAEAAEQRTARLQSTTTALGRVMSSAEAARTALEHGLGLFGADAGVAYVLRDDALHVLATLRRDPPDVLPMTADYPLTAVARSGQPMFLQDRDEMLRACPGLVGMIPDDLQASMVLPLVVDERVIGVIGVNFLYPRAFFDEDRQFAGAVAAQAALAIDRALLMERDRERANRAAFLAEASEVMAKTLDREQVLEELVRIVVPRFADWVQVDLVDGEVVRQTAVGHVDPAKVVFAKRLRERFPPDPARTFGVYQVTRTGKPELYPVLSPEVIESGARDAEHLELMRALQMRSAMIVPMIASGKPIGAISAVWAESGNHYDESDLEMFMELARRAALAVENAHLYRDLRQAVQVRDDFLAAAGHELKTPLAALQMHVDGLERQLRKNVVPTNLPQRLAKASQAGTRLAKLIDELLDVSRITAGRLQLEPEQFALDELVREVVERFPEQAGTSITLTTEPVTGTWDRGRIDQVVSNLVANALKYGRGAPIDIDVRQVDGSAMLRVTDRGIGIAVAEQQKIFERFERAVENREYGGFGLGLWIARQIVETSGGTIEVSSEPGQGATFTVRLPR